ncbi:RICIN domain-containing protein [Streptomyces albus]|uniref:RICIN domain-containing protein n=1 Tax=Streptomyces albus TaxID=1888 RepID=UPI0006E44CD2|nr:RICIN domain-containing protein [Streptomyces albus]
MTDPADSARRRQAPPAGPVVRRAVTLTDAVAAPSGELAPAEPASPGAGRDGDGLRGGTRIAGATVDVAAVLTGDPTAPRTEPATTGSAITEPAGGSATGAPPGPASGPAAAPAPGSAPGPGADTDARPKAPAPAARAASTATTTATTHAAPATKPATPAAEPAASAAESAASASKPAASAADSPTLAGKPTTPAAKPATPAVKSAASAAKSTTPAARSAASATTKATGRTAAGAAAVATATSPPPPTGSDPGPAGGLPRSRPPKAVLAGLAFVGALLIAVPFLLLGGGDDGEKKPAARTGNAPHASAPTGPGADGADGKGTEDGRQHPGDKDGKHGKHGDDGKHGAKKSDGAAGTEDGRAGHGGEGHPAAGGAPDAGQGARTSPGHSGGVRNSTVSPAGTDYSTRKNVRITNAFYGYCADIPGTGPGQPDGPVNVDTCAGGSPDNQRWDFVRHGRRGGSGGAYLFEIRNRTDGRCMDLSGSGRLPAGTLVIETACAGKGNQLWWAEKRDGGRLWLHNSGSGQQCLNVQGAAGVANINARLEIQPCRGGDDHEWKL